MIRTVGKIDLMKRISRRCCVGTRIGKSAKRQIASGKEELVRSMKRRTYNRPLNATVVLGSRNPTFSVTGVVGFGPVDEDGT